MHVRNASCSFFRPHSHLQQNDVLEAYWDTLGEMAILTNQKGCPKIGGVKLSLPTSQDISFAKIFIFSKIRNTVIKSVSQTSDHLAWPSGHTVPRRTSSSCALLPSGSGSLTRTYYSQPSAIMAKNSLRRDFCLKLHLQKEKIRFPEKISSGGKFFTQV